MAFDKSSFLPEIHAEAEMVNHPLFYFLDFFLEFLLYDVLVLSLHSIGPSPNTISDFLHSSLHLSVYGRLQPLPSVLVSLFSHILLPHLSRGTCERLCVISFAIPH